MALVRDSTPPLFGSRSGVQAFLCPALREEEVTFAGFITSAFGSLPKLFLSQLPLSGDTGKLPIDFELCAAGVKEIDEEVASSYGFAASL